MIAASASFVQAIGVMGGAISLVAFVNACGPVERPGDAGQRLEAIVLAMVAWACISAGKLLAGFA